MEYGKSKERLKMIKYANEIIKENENMKKYEKYNDKDNYICGEEFEKWLRTKNHKRKTNHDRTRI